MRAISSPSWLLVLALSIPAQAAPLLQARPESKPPAGKAAADAAAAAKAAAATKTGDTTAAGKAGDDPPAITEKSLLVDFNKSWSASDVAARASATTALGDASRSLEDGGASKAVARALGKGLLDEDLEVRAACVSQLGWGRHVDSVIEMLSEGLPDLLSQVDRRLTRPDEESRTYVNRGTRLVGDASAVLANYRDDRSVDALVSMLRSLDRNTTGGNNLSTLVVQPIARAVLSLGSHDAVEAAVRQTQTYVGAGGRQDAAAKLLHKALAEYAVGFGQAPPEYSENVSVAWNQWWEKVEDRLPQHLGRLKLPPAAPPAMEMKGKRYEKDDGSAPRQ